ncbi:MAG: 30S ribosomal protein S16 [Cyclobacteriaceae bacterium]|nr:30S ribosomal protein S16 [Cyclobacteriaceae bacterium]
MAVKIRLARRGRKARAMYDVVVADARAPRDGRFIEKIGTYNPNVDPAAINIDDEKAFNWVMDGAQPTDTVRAMLSHRGVMLKKHLQVGVNKGAITQEAADKKFDAWLNEKEGKIAGKVDQIAKSKSASDKARRDAETKVKEARAEALAAKAAAAAKAAEPAEEVAEEAPEAVTETPAEEVAVEAAPEAVVETPVAEEAAPEAKAEETPAPKAEAETEAPSDEAPSEDKK